MGASALSKFKIGFCVLLLGVYFVNSIWNLFEIVRGPQKVQAITLSATEKEVADTVISALVLGDYTKAMPVFDETFVPPEKMGPVLTQINQFLKSSDGFVRGYFPFSVSEIAADSAKKRPAHREVFYFIEKSDNSKLAVSLGLRKMENGSIKVIGLWTRSLASEDFSANSRRRDFFWGGLCLLLFIFTTTTVVMVLRSDMSSKWSKSLLVFLNGGCAVVSMAGSGTWELRLLLNTNTFYILRPSIYGDPTYVLLLPVGALILQVLLNKRRFDMPN